MFGKYEEGKMKYEKASMESSVEVMKGRRNKESQEMYGIGRRSSREGNKERSGGSNS